jgi:hypothetical protein
VRTTRSPEFCKKFIVLCEDEGSLLLIIIIYICVIVNFSSYTGAPFFSANASALLGKLQ